jgi:hypothetical protein
VRKLIACAFLCACASQGAPPGGPPDTQAPVLLSISPDSGALSVKRDAAIFRFDEVVAERPAGVTNLGDLFIVSPRQGAPNVSWHRSEIQVKPRRGWLPNTTYTVMLLPGIADLRGNVRNTGVSTFFSTGPAIDKAAVSGTIYDLLTGSPINGALVEARAAADTTVSWLTRADSNGVFRLTHLPARDFLLRAYLDRNKNFGADPDEPTDTSSVTVRDSARADFFLAVRDSAAPRLASALATDSVTIAISFDRPSDSASVVNAANYSITASDSTVVAIRAVVVPPRDTTRKRPVSARALPLGSVALSLASPLSLKKSYRLRAVGVRGLLGQTLPSEIPITSAAPPAIRVPVIPPSPANLPGGAVPIPIKHE